MSRLTYRELEEITDVAYDVLKLWKSQGYFGEDGMRSGGDPVDFDQRVVTIVLWMKHLQSFRIQLPTAFKLILEAVEGLHTDVLVLTPDGHRWVTHKVAKDLFDDYPAYLAISIPHFIEMVDARVRAFRSVAKMRSKIGFLDNSEKPRLSLVH